LKFSIYILLVYLVTLAVIPCCTFDECPDGQKIAGNKTTPGDSKKDCGACSPFFNCEKCASATIKADDVQMDYVRSIILSIYSEFIPSRLKAAYYEFWQPPRYC
jgi:hypothetical protein